MRTLAGSGGTAESNRHGIFERHEAFPVCSVNAKSIVLNMSSSQLLQGNETPGDHGE
jgi:hypothetical protein